METEVETWGYPLRYNLTAPILSRGYLSGYDEGLDAKGRLKNPLVEHLIVNGAFNPGSLGGPLIDRKNGKVIGIVVEKWRMYSPLIEAAIRAARRILDRVKTEHTLARDTATVTVLPSCRGGT